MLSGVPVAKELILMIKVYHTPVTYSSSTDTTSTTASTAANNTVICWTCLGLTVKTGKKHILAL